MQLIGMLDSPFVRRVAIALRLLDLPYEHRPLSVFRNFRRSACSTRWSRRPRWC